MQKIKTTTIKKPAQDKLINLQLTRGVAEEMLSEVKVSLENIMFNEKGFDELYQLYKTLTAKLAK